MRPIRAYRRLVGAIMDWQVAGVEALARVASQLPGGHLLEPMIFIVGVGVILVAWIAVYVAWVAVGAWMIGWGVLGLIDALKEWLG